MPNHLTEAQLSQFRSEGHGFPFRAVNAGHPAQYRARIEAYETQAGHAQLTAAWGEYKDMAIE